MSSKRIKIHSTIASLIGNTLEWYEYTLYTYFASVISALFFPDSNGYIGILMTFMTFAVGLAARPIGGIIFGYIGDKYSRKKMLAITILMMSLPTLGIGLLPSYHQIGIAAPLILVILRIIQGISLGGEFGASCVYLYESAPQSKRSFFGTLSLTGVGSGLILSSCTIFVIESVFTQEEIMSYAWRIPFFIGVIGAIIGFYMRRSLLETPDFVKAQKDKLLIENPLKEMLKHHKITILKLFSVFLTTQISFFVVFIFGKSMMIEFFHYSPHLAGKFSLFTVLSYTVSTVIFGYLADKTDKRNIILAGTIGILFASYPFILALQANNPNVILGVSILLGALIGMTEGTLNPLVAESFPTQIRATSVAFCWNFTSVVFGATAPIIAILLMQYFSLYFVAYFLMTACFISIVGMIFIISNPAR